MDESSIPASGLPDLTILGLDEVDRGVVEDNAINRAVLRKNRYFWQPIWNEDGTLSPLIQAISPEMREHATANAEEKRALILEDHRRKNSDYVTGFDLIMVPDVEALVPAWVLQVTNEWRKIETERETNPHYKSTVLGPPGRCRAIKADGSRCLLWHAGRDAQEMCRIHMGVILQQPRTAQIHERVRQKFDALSLRAADVLEELLEDESSPVKMRAVENIFNRNGFREGIDISQEVDVTVKPASELIADRLAKLRKNTLEHEANLRAAIEAPESEDDADDE